MLAAKEIQLYNRKPVAKKIQMILNTQKKKNIKR
jgi:hypothetical protein